MKNTLISITLLFYSFAVAAQVPGYIGKRFSIGYSNYLFPSLFFPSAKTTEPFTLGLNTTHCINLNYVIKNRTSFCFEIQTNKTGLSIKEIQTYYALSSGNTLLGNVIYQTKDKLPMQMNSINFSIGFKFFNRGFIAPLGKYWKLEFLLIASKVRYEKNSFYYGAITPDNLIVTPIGLGVYNYKSFAVAYTIGRQRIFKDVLIIDTGIRFGLVPEPIIEEVISSVFDGSSNAVWSMEDQVKSDVKFRLFTQQLISFHIGIGFLAF